jgi:outer membrane lipoprotein SlyB
VSINEVALRGGGSSGGTGGMMTGGLIGAVGGSAIGAVASHTLGGALVGALLGGVGGAIAGNIVNNHTSMGSGGRGIEVTVQKDDGQTVRVAQRDEGDIQLGDRVQIVQDRNGTARAVHDNSRAPDYGPQNGGPQNGGPQNSGPPPQDMQSSSNQRYVPRGPDYQPSSGTQYGGAQYGGAQYNGPQDQNGVPPAEYGQRYNQSRSAPSPQDDPRYGNLD